MFARVLKGVGGLIAPGHKELEKFNQRCFGQSLRNLDRTVYATEPDLHASILERLESEIRAARGEDSTMLEQVVNFFLAVHLPDDNIFFKNVFRLMMILTTGKP